MESLPRPVYARVKSLPGGSWKPKHAHSWAQLTYAVKGVLVVRTDRGAFLAPPQRAVWVPPGIEHEVVTTIHTELRNFFVDPGCVRWDTTSCRVLEISPFARELIGVIASLPVEYDEAGPQGRLVRVFLDQLDVLPEACFSLPMPTTPMLLKYCSELVARLNGHDLKGSIAKSSGMSERTMARVFLRETGLTFRDWRVRLKLLVSVESLEASRNVTQAALDCGYDSTSAYITAFKKHLGKTPGELLRGLYS